MIAGLGGILYGFDMGIIAAVLVFVRESFALSTRMEEIVVSVVLVGAMSGAIAGGSIADRIGRRSTLVWGGIIFLLGSLLAFWSPNVTILIVARGLLGIAIGFTSVTAPVYVSELAPPQSRGLLIGLYQFALTIGIVLADLVGYWLAGQHAWRTMFGLGAVPAALFLALIFTLPESPRWLFAQNRMAEMQSVLSSYTDAAGATLLIEEIRHGSCDSRGAALERTLETRSAHFAFHRGGLYGAAAGHRHQHHHLLRTADFLRWPALHRTRTQSSPRCWLQSRTCWRPLLRLSWSIAWDASRCCTRA